MGLGSLRRHRHEVSAPDVNNEPETVEPKNEEEDLVEESHPELGLENKAVKHSKVKKS